MICSFEHHAVGISDDNCFLNDDESVLEKWVPMSKSEGGPSTDHTLHNEIGM